MGPLSCGCAAQERCDQDLIIHWYTKEEGWRGSEGRDCGSEGKERDKSLSINESVVYFSSFLTAPLQEKVAKASNRVDTSL